MEQHAYYVVNASDGEVASACAICILGLANKAGTKRIIRCDREDNHIAVAPGAVLLTHEEAIAKAQEFSAEISPIAEGLP